MFCVIVIYEIFIYTFYYDFDASMTLVKFIAVYNPSSIKKDILQGVINHFFEKDDLDVPERRFVCACFIWSKIRNLVLLTVICKVVPALTQITFLNVQNKLNFIFLRSRPELRKKCSSQDSNPCVSGLWHRLED